MQRGLARTRDSKNKPSRRQYEAFRPPRLPTERNFEDNSPYERDENVSPFAPCSPAAPDHPALASDPLVNGLERPSIRVRGRNCVPECVRKWVDSYNRRVPGVLCVPSSIEEGNEEAQEENEPGEPTPPCPSPSSNLKPLLPYSNPPQPTIPNRYSGAGTQIDTSTASFEPRPSASHAADPIILSEFTRPAWANDAAMEGQGALVRAWAAARGVGTGAWGWVCWGVWGLMMPVRWCVDCVGVCGRRLKDEWAEVEEDSDYV